MKLLITKTARARLSRWIGSVLVGAVLAHMPAVAQERVLQGRAEGLNARIEVLGAGFAQPGAVASGQSRLVVYRVGADRGNDALTVLVNGRYHASLVPAAFSDVCLTPGPVRLGVRQVRVADGGRDGVQQELAVQLPPGALTYVKVQAGLLQPVPAQQAQLELQGARAQIHTVSRIAQACQAGEPAPVVASGTPQRHELVLLADSTFEFGRADEAALTAMGQLQMQHLVDRLREDFGQIDHIRVRGHADPLGAAAANEQLALTRARTIARMLDNALGGKTRIEALSAGEREPLVSGCPMQRSERAIVCHAPNRRVNIEVTGLAR